MKRISSRALEATERQTGAGRQISALLLLLIFGGALAVVPMELMAGAQILLGICATLFVLGAAAGGGDANPVKAGIQRGAGGRPREFTLSLGNEVVMLQPGMSWAQVDKYKWCARGLIDVPHVFNVLPDGTVEINWEKIVLTDKDGQTKLQHQINSRFTSKLPQKKSVAAIPTYSDITRSQTAQSAGVRFKVRLDRFGHMLISCSRGGETEETGLRGITALISSGSMLKPNEFHVDPMQRAVDIDGVRFECTEKGARQLEEALNTRYVPISTGDSGIAIEIKENVAATTGFDIHFMTIQAGVPVEVKGHLTQEYLDILQDHKRCDLLQPGIQLRLSPPYLLARRRRPDMGEDRIPGLPDINYLQVTAAQIQQVFNHPLIRKGAAAQQARQATQECPANVKEIRLVRNPGDRKLLWLECVTTDGETHKGKAFTYHNIAELQHRGFFLPHLDVCLSLDHRALSILNKQNKQEETITIDERSSDENLLKAGSMLTKALKPYVRVIAKSPSQQPLSATAKPEVAFAATERVEAVRKPFKESLPIQSKAAPAALSKREIDPALAALFQETDPVRINAEIFRRLSPCFGIEVQDVLLSMPMVFDDRRFEIINFEGEEITDVMGLRDEWTFYGFYLSHINERKAVLVYASNGTHIEWGPDRCVLQRVKMEPEEYKGSALLGMAQDKNNEFVFIVQPAFKEWIKAREKHCVDVTVYFLTVAELAVAADKYKWIWPERPAAGQNKSDVSS